jgi:DNA replication and repair protein RecF
MSGLAPLALLDEVAAHFDPRRRAALFDALERVGAQVFVTGADPAVFAELGDRARMFEVVPGRVRPWPGV